MAENLTSFLFLGDIESCEVMMFSATLSADTRDICKKFMQSPDPPSENPWKQKWKDWLTWNGLVL